MAERHATLGARPPARASARLLLALIGGLSLASYLAFNFYLGQSPRFLSVRTTELIERVWLWRQVAQLPDLSANEAFRLGLAGSALLLAGYGLALGLAWGRPATPRLLGMVAGFGLLFGLTSLLALPNLHGNIVMYSLFGHISTAYAANPYIFPPAAFAPDPMLAYALPSQLAKPTPYGPLWTMTSQAIALWAGADMARAILGHRTLLFALHLGNLALVWAILGRLHPAHRLAALVAYGWNPIVVGHATAHLDLAMLTGALAAVYATLRRREWLGLLSLAASVLLKFITAPLLAVYLVYWWRRRSFGLALLGGLAAIGLAALMLLPFWHGPGMLLYFLGQASAIRPNGLLSRELLAIAGLLILTVWAGWQGRRQWIDMLRGWALVMIWFSWFFAPAAASWYHITTLGVLSLLPLPGAALMALALTISGLLTTTLTAFVLDPATVPSWIFQSLRWGLPVLVLAGLAAWHGLRAARPLPVPTHAHTATLL